MDLLVDLMNRFPLFALLLRIKDPRRIPGTISCILFAFFSTLLIETVGSLRLRFVPGTDANPQHLFLEVRVLFWATEHSIDAFDIDRNGIVPDDLHAIWVLREVQVFQCVVTGPREDYIVSMLCAPIITRNT